MNPSGIRTFNSIHFLANNITISPGRIYKVTLSQDYVLEENDGTDNIFNEKSGYGAISIKSYQIQNDYNFDLEKELRDFSTSIDKKVDKNKLQVISGSNASCEFVINGKFWKLWVLFKNGNAVFATYNCDENDCNDEIDIVNEIIQSLQIL